jgi:hypothetical protein
MTSKTRLFKELKEARRGARREQAHRLAHARCRCR